MSEPTEDVAEHIMGTMGEGPALVISMRLVLSVGHLRNETPGMLEAVQEAIVAIKRVGALTGAFELA